MQKNRKFNADNISSKVVDLFKKLNVSFGYIKQCVDRDLNCIRNSILPSCEYLKSQSALFQAVYRES
jgi:hypothetical protein